MNPFFYRLPLILVLVAFSAQTAHAVNIYDALQHIDTFDDNGFYADIGAGGVLKTGNSDFGSIAGSSYFGYRTDSQAFLLSGLAEYTEAKGSQVANNSLEHLRYRHYLTRSESWAVEAFAQHERDNFRRIRLRALAGGAVRYALPEMGPVRTALGTGAFAEAIRINTTAGSPDSGSEYEALRNSTYLTLAVEPKKGGLFGFTGYYQPRINDIRDYRMSGKAFIEAKAGDFVKVEVFSGIAYDVSPASAVKKTDSTSGFKIGIEFEPPKPARTDDGCPPSAGPGLPVDATSMPPAEQPPVETPDNSSP